MSPRTIRTLWLSIAAAALIASGCAGGRGASEAEPTSPQEPAAGTDAETMAPDEAQEASPAAEPLPLKVSTLNFPSLVVAIPPIIAEQGFDVSNGFELEIEPFADIGAFYAAQTNASVDAGVGGVNVYQRLVGEGADMQIIASYVGLDPLLVIADDPEIQSIEDLPGKRFAATVASAEYQVLAIYALSKGIDLESDVTLVNASPADVRTQLEAGRVDAAMLWEPGAALALADNPDYRIILNGGEAWEELTGQRGWELVWAMQRSYIEEHPELVEGFTTALQDAVEWLFANQDEAAVLMEEASGMPADAFKEVLAQGRVDYDVQPAWDEEVRASLMTHFDEALEAGFLESLPPDDIIYEPAS